MRSASVILTFRREPPRMVRILREHPEMTRSEAAKRAREERKEKAK